MTLYARYLCSRDALVLSAARDDRVSCIQSMTLLSDEVTHRIAACTVSGRDHETITHVPRDTHVTKQRMAMRSSFLWSDFKKLGTPELSPKNFEKRAHPSTVLQLGFLKIT